MKLTPEQQAALEQAMQERFPRTDMPTLPGEEAAFLAGCRYQHQITLERAARLISTGDFCRYVEHVQDYCDCGPMAAAIRALPYETKDE